MLLISADDKFIQFQTNSIIRQKSSNGRLWERKKNMINARLIIIMHQYHWLSERDREGVWERILRFNEKQKHVDEFDGR